MNILNLRSSRFVAKLGAVIGLGKRPLMTGGERKAVLALQAEFDRMEQQAVRYGVDGYRFDLHEARTRVVNHPTPENVAALDELQKSPAEVAKRHAAIRSTLAEARRNFCRTKVWPAIQPILERALTMAQKQAEEIEAAERKAADSVGVPFDPSETLRAVCGAARQLSERIEQYSRPEVQQLCRPDMALELDEEGQQALRERKPIEPKPSAVVHNSTAEAPAPRVIKAEQPSPNPMQFQNHPEHADVIHIRE